MATLVNKNNPDVKVIIPNMREFRVFFSDNEGSVMFFKRDWAEEKQEEHWKPSEEQMEALDKIIHGEVLLANQHKSIESLYNDLKKLM